LLTPLLPSSKAKKNLARTWIQGLLRNPSIETRIQASINAFINHVLLGTALPSEVKTSKLADQIYPLIIEIHRVRPQLLERVIPSVSGQLRAETGAIDLSAVKAMQKMFDLHVNSGLISKEFLEVFGGFLFRFNNLFTFVRPATDGEVPSKNSSYSNKDGYGPRNQSTYAVDDPQSDVTCSEPIHSLER
jgi:hypothetical protein